jgi:hypothetical protein
VVEVPDIDKLDLPSFGLAGLENLAARMRALEPTLPPRERVTALQAEARILAAHEALKQKQADARRDYFESQEFKDDVRVLAAALPDGTELRRLLARFGVSLPEPPATATTGEIAGPETAEDVEEVIVELEAAAKLRSAGEPGLAAARIVALNLEGNGNAIARVIAGKPKLAGRLLELLDGADAALIRTALERHMALKDVAALPAEARACVAELLRQLGCADAAHEIEGG